jgi:hypothetical protein
MSTKVASAPSLHVERLAPSALPSWDRGSEAVKQVSDEGREKFGQAKG